MAQQHQVSYSLCIGELRVNFLDRPYEIQMGLYQMVLLLLFNDTLSLTVADIVQQSSLSEADVLRSLKVWSCKDMAYLDSQNV